MDSKAATNALVALGAVAAWEGIALFACVGDPVPHFNAAAEADAKELLRDWRRYFEPAMNMQKKLVILGAASAGVTAWGLRDSEPRAAAAFAAVVGLNVAIFGYTVKRIFPVNARLLPGGDADKESPAGVLALLREWGQLHGVRTTMGAAALAAAGYGLHCLLTRK